MDFNLKQWRNQDGSEEQHSTKMPKLLPESHHHHQQPQSAADASALPLFAPEPNSSSKVSILSDATLATNTNNIRFPRMESYFSIAQWQELELQALIFRYMLAGAAVPPELLQPIKKSLIHSTPYFLQHYQPAAAAALLQSGYWAGAAMDPEPGRCRRTDGKKWRCSRDVVAGQKYCERHMHRGRNRSRKPVELPTPTGAGGGGATNLVAASSSSISSPPLASVSFKSPFDLLHLNDRTSGTKDENKSVFENQDHHHHHHVGGDGRSGGHMLRHFFDDWPRSLQEPDNAESNGGGGGGGGRMNMNSATSLSISTSSMLGNNSSSDVSLKLSTGYGGEDRPGPRNGNVEPEGEAEQLQLSWAGGWTSGNQVASMGGPLAEALRSSTSTSSPTSVLHQLPRASASETSFIST